MRGPLSVGETWKPSSFNLSPLFDSFNQKTQRNNKIGKYKLKGNCIPNPSLKSSEVAAFIKSAAVGGRESNSGHFGSSRQKVEAPESCKMETGKCWSYSQLSVNKLSFLMLLSSDGRRCWTDAIVQVAFNRCEVSDLAFLKCEVWFSFFFFFFGFCGAKIQGDFAFSKCELLSSHLLNAKTPWTELYTQNAPFVEIF